MHNEVFKYDMLCQTLLDMKLILNYIDFIVLEEIKLLKIKIKNKSILIIFKTSIFFIICILKSFFWLSKCNRHNIIFIIIQIK